MSGATTKALVTFDTAIVIDTITRPANATPYTAGDVIANNDDSYLTFPGSVKPPKWTGMISGARIMSSANQATKPDIEMWLFRSPPTEIADNDAFAPSDAEVRELVGIVSFPVASWQVGNPGSGAAGNCVCEAMPKAIPLRGGVNPSDTIYGLLVVRNAYTPVSAEEFRVELLVTQD